MLDWPVLIARVCVSLVLAGIPSLPPKQKVRRSLAPRPLNVMSTLRRVWTEEEVSRLIQGVRRYGEGEWAVIKSQMKFTARSNVNLKDKWRQIKKTVDLSRDSEENGKWGCSVMWTPPLISVNGFYFTLFVIGIWQQIYCTVLRNVSFHWCSMEIHPASWMPPTSHFNSLWPSDAISAGFCKKDVTPMR